MRKTLRSTTLILILILAAGLLAGCGRGPKVNGGQGAPTGQSAPSGQSTSTSQPGLTQAGADPELDQVDQTLGKMMDEMDAEGTGEITP